MTSVELQQEIRQQPARVAPLQRATPLEHAETDRRPSWCIVPRRLGGVVGFTVLLAIVVGIWQAWVSLGHVAAIVAPHPAAVARDLAGHPGLYLDAMGQTLWVTLLGLVVGLSAGSLLAVSAWWSPVSGALVRPVAAFMRTVPLVAAIPVLARVLGYGSKTTVVVTAVLAFFPSYVLVGSGLRSLPPGSPDLLRTLGSTRRSALLHLVLPSALSNFLIAVRIAVTLCVLGAVSAEYLTGIGGLGYLFAVSRQNYSNTARGWGVAVVAGAMSLVAYGLVSWGERKARERLI